jgi:hypothetical protein
VGGSLFDCHHAAAFRAPDSSHQYSISPITQLKYPINPTFAAWCLERDGRLATGRDQLPRFEPKIHKHTLLLIHQSYVQSSAYRSSHHSRNEVTVFMAIAFNSSSFVETLTPSFTCQKFPKIMCPRRVSLQ